MFLYALLSRNPLLLSVSMAMLLIYYNEYKSFEDANKAVERLRIARTVNTDMCRELEYVEITISITNQGSIAIPRAVVTDVLPRYVVPERGKAQFDVTVPPGATITIVYRARVTAPGAHDFNELLLAIYDALGYFYNEYKFSIRTTVVALPLSNSIEMGVESLQRLTSTAIMGKATGGSYNIANVREYMDGDDIRRIMWKVYARMGKLMVREDYGEARVRVLVLIDMRKYLWGIGEEPNTLAHMQLRYARSLIEYIARSGSTLDISICSGITPKVVENANTALVESLYRVFSVLEGGGGCESPIDAYIHVPGYLGRSVDSYDAVVLVTNPITLVLESPKNVRELLKMFGAKLVIIVLLARSVVELIGEDRAKQYMESLMKGIEQWGAKVYVPQEIPVVDVRWLR